MSIEDIQKIYTFSFLEEPGSFWGVNVIQNPIDLVMKSHILVRQNDNIWFQWKLRIKSPPEESVQRQFSNKFSQNSALFVIKSAKTSSF